MEFMSQEGYDELVAELNHMIKVELPKAIDAVSEARDKGDLRMCWPMPVCSTQTG